MTAVVDRIFVSGGNEYRLTAGGYVGKVPRDVLDEMLRYGLVKVDEKPARKTGRRKKNGNSD